MKRKTRKAVIYSRKAWYVGVLLMELALSGLFGCGKAEEYTVAVGESGRYAETAQGPEKDAGAEADFAGADNAAGTGQAENASATDADAAANASANASAANAASIYVDISGAVCNPGVYALAADARVFEGIEAAGGLLPEACTKSLNQAQLLTDGQKIYVPTTEEWESSDQETAAFTENTPTKEQDDGLININTADAVRLCELPGVGESRAQAIIRYREENGPFTDIAQIQNVSGIKSGLFSKIRDLITVQ